MTKIKISRPDLIALQIKMMNDSYMDNLPNVTMMRDPLDFRPVGDVTVHEIDFVNQEFRYLKTIKGSGGVTIIDSEAEDTNYVPKKLLSKPQE